MTPNEWILSNDVGISSKTIWAVMMGVVTEQQKCNFKYDTPSDPSDFGRCYRLLVLFPDWRNRLNEVSVIFPKWKPLVDNWHKLEKLWIEEFHKGECPKLYQLMKELNTQCLIADGWIKTSEYSWERKNS